MRKYKLNYNLSTLLLLAVTLAISGCQQSSSSLPPSSPVQLSITGIQPSEAKVGEDIIIVGTKFGTSQGLSTITLNGQSLTGAISSWSDTEIRMTIPGFAVSGMVQITDTNGKSSNETQLVVPWDKENPENVAVTTAVNEQQMVKAVSDGQGGAIIVWRDERTSGTTGFDIYVQHIDSRGRSMWENGVGTGDFNGILVSNAPGNQTFPQITSDGQGGAIICWQDGRNGNLDIFAQRIDSRGLRLWINPSDTDAYNGIEISTVPGLQLYPKLVPDDSGGAIIIWEDNRVGENITPDIYAQRVDAKGARQWRNTINPGYIYDGVPVSVAPSRQSSPQLIIDGYGGAIISWDDSRESTKNKSGIYAQKINKNGIRQWQYGSGIDILNGVPISIGRYDKASPQIAVDNSGGAIIVWQDYRNFTTTDVDIYAQRVNNQGVRLWANGTGSDELNGIVISSAIAAQYGPQIIENDVGGATIFWGDTRNNLTSSGDIYAQRINASGIPQWSNTVDADPDNGIPITTAANNQDGVNFTKDNKGNVVVTWNDFRNGTDSNIFAQKINPKGVRLWKNYSMGDENNGIPICTAPKSQRGSQLVADKFGGATIVWTDDRNDINAVSDIYAQGITANGRQ